MDSITLLKTDHKAVQRLFKRFENAGDDARVEKREIVDRIIEELSVHAAIEEQLFYPVVRATVPDAAALTLESLEEHHIVKWTLDELEHLAADDERFDAKVTVLIEHVRHHVEEEEGELFPKVRKALGRAALNDLGDAMLSAKESAPTHPHPRSADTPPGNVVAGAAAGVADRVGDTVSGIAQGGVSVVSDIIATVLRRKKPPTAPTGSTQDRKTAGRVRDIEKSVTQRVRPAKKAPAKKAPAKRANATKKTAKKVTNKRAAVKRSAASRSTAKRSTGKRAAAKR